VSTAQRPRILIADDDESMRLLLARILSSDLGAEVQLAGTCEQAERLAESHAYDAILLDLVMPGRGGLGVLRAIRGGRTNSATPVVVVSVLSDDATMRACAAAGATAFHLKPVRREALSAAVRQAIASRPSRPSA
jgi:CheY-like chemotaxis protein